MVEAFLEALAGNISFETLLQRVGEHLDSVINSPDEFVAAKVAAGLSHEQAAAEYVKYLSGNLEVKSEMIGQVEEAVAERVLEQGQYLNTEIDSLLSQLTHAPVEGYVVNGETVLLEQEVGKFVEPNEAGALHLYDENKEDLGAVESTFIYDQGGIREQLDALNQEIYEARQSREFDAETLKKYHAEAQRILGSLSQQRVAGLQ